MITAPEIARLASAAIVAAALGCAGPPPPAATPLRAAAPMKITPDALQRGLVSVRATGQDRSYKQPWTRLPAWTRTGTGLAVDGHRVLVGGRHFDPAGSIEVQRWDGTKAAARLVVEDVEARLAVLAVDDPGFWAGVTPLPIAPTVPHTGAVGVLRRPFDGGVQPAVGMVHGTLGVVLGTGWTSCLGIEIQDGFKEPETSEAVVGAQGVVGVVTVLRDKTALVMASPVLRDFLAEADHAPYRGFASIGFVAQSVRDPALRDHLGLAPTEGGARIDRILPQGSAAGALSPGDVLLAVAGMPIDAHGHVNHPTLGEIPFTTVFNLDGRHPGDRVEVTVLRGGQRTQTSVALKRVRFEDEVIPGLFINEPLEYTVQGGLVFESLSAAYLMTWGPTWEVAAPLRLLSRLSLEEVNPTPGKKRVIVLTQVLPDPANLGYEKLNNVIVASVNGVPAETMADVRAAFKKPSGGFDVVELAPGQGVRRIVLDAAQVEAADRRLREVYGPALSGP